MLLTIFDRYNQKRADICPNENSTQSKEVQGDNILALSFTLYEHITLDVNDYIDFHSERYWLMERYSPKQKSSIEWEYNLNFYGVESLLKRFLVLKTVDGENEPVFTLTAPPLEHVKLIVECLNEGMGKITDFKVGAITGTENIVVDYEGKYLDEALKEIAEKVGAEWWIEGQTLNVSRCEHGEEVTLGYGKGLTELEKDQADNAKFYTRLFPIGSNKNINREQYGYSRLQLPNHEKFVDINVDKYGIIHHYEADAFSDIFPRRIGVVSSVRSEIVTGEDGTPFKIFYFKDDSLTFNPNDYELPGLVKRVSFQEGSALAGLGNEEDGTYFFEVNFDSKTREFEIITIWPYDDDTQLPNEILAPCPKNKYILWNISMPDEYYALAEEEFKTAVNKYNQEHGLDISRYKAPTDHVYIEESSIDLFIGCRVKLESTEFFPEGFRRSRITKIVRNVNLPSKMDLEISDALSKSSLSKMGDDITDIKNYTRQISDSNLPGVIRSWDKTIPTDNNLFSARRSQKEFLSKKENDRAKGLIRFEKGLKIGFGEYGIEDSGAADLLSSIVKKYLRSPNFVDGFNGEGWEIWMDDVGLSHLTIDQLTVRQTWRVMELLIARVKSVGGELVVSAANGKIREVIEEGDYYQIRFEQECQFESGDLIRCARFDKKSYEYHSYWVEVKQVTSEGITVLKDDFNGYSPEISDEVVLMGNCNNPHRQNLIVISAANDGLPRIDVFDGVKSTNFAGCLRARLGCLDGIEDERFGADRPQGYGLFADNAYLRGKFLMKNSERDVETQFAITEGKIEAAVEGLRQDFVADKGFLKNATFGEGMDGWKTENEVTFFLAGNKWIWANGHALGHKENYAAVTTDMGRKVVHIRNRYIKQLNSHLHKIPKFSTNADGEVEAAAVYLSFYYRCAKAGRLKVEFEDMDKTGFADFNSLCVEEDLSTTEGYEQFTCNGLWNGTGDFVLSFTGEIYLYMLVLSTDRIEGLTYKYRTLFEQSERLAKLSAAIYDKDENLLRETGLMVRPEGSGIFMQGADGKLALIGVGVEETDANGETKTVVKLTADNIRLEGLVTANENFKILDDGSIAAKNGTFSGRLEGATGFFTGFVLRTPTVITDVTIGQYIDHSYDEFMPDNGCVLDLAKCGSFIYMLAEEFSSTIYLPSVYPGESMVSPLSLTRAYIGSTYTFYNISSNGSHGISGRCIEGGSITPHSYVVKPGKFAVCVCKCQITNGEEDIYWEITIGTMNEYANPKSE